MDEALAFQGSPRCPPSTSALKVCEFVRNMEKKWPILVAPSLLSADFGYLADEAKRAEEAGANALHIDIMDGHFVPNLTLGPRAVAAVNRATPLFLDVHVMIYNPFDYVERFAEAGADRITFHFEATENVEETLEYIRKCNIEAGLAFSPDTSASMIQKFLTRCDLILLMTVHPGFGGQSFISKVLEKVRYVRDLCDRLHIRYGGAVSENQDEIAPFSIQVDGGVNEKTIHQCVKAGANSFVSGTYLYKSPDMRQAIQTLRSAADL
jgi:ribulose-phosphate 3-epimerase